MTLKALAWLSALALSAHVAVAQEAGGELTCQNACGSAFTGPDTYIICSCHLSCLLELNCCVDMEQKCPSDWAQGIQYAMEQKVSQLAAVPDPAGLYGACGLVSQDGKIEIPVSVNMQEHKGSCKGVCGSMLVDSSGSCPPGSPIQRCCYCDSGCLLTNDCCPDFEQVCDVDPCLKGKLGEVVYPDTCSNGQCGRAVPSMFLESQYCYCDDGCIPNGDCCPDYAAHCTIPAKYQPKFTQATGSCFQRCATKSGTCWCDHQCTANGDCCSDFFKHCSFTVPMYSVIGRGSCEANCGKSSWDCFCDTQCMVAGDCCADFLDKCPTLGLKLK